MQNNPPTANLTITWLGHACFLLTGSAGTTILLDPMLPGMGYELPDLGRVNAVLVTHNHRDHNYVQAAPNSRHIFGLDESGHFQSIKQQIDGTTIYDVTAFHDDTQGSKRGEDALWIIEMEGLRLMHMGDFGQPELTSQQLAEIGQIDILMIPVSGTFTIDGEAAHHVVAQLQPALVIPMHYLTAALPAGSPHRPVDEFIGQPAPADAPHTIILHKSDLHPGQAQVVVMSYR
jgi:L-ascorbate metabolism protein UlaG (beta-lactamase superfamily)